MENTKLEMLSTMVTSALANIIDENSKSDFTVADVMAKYTTTEDCPNYEGIVNFRIELIDRLLDDFIFDVIEQWKIGRNFYESLNVTNIKSWLDQANEEDKKTVYNYLTYNSLQHNDVVQYLKNVDRSELCDLLNESDQMCAISEELEEDIVTDWLDSASASDVIDKCSSSLEDDFRDYFRDSVKEDVIDECIDALKDLY